MTDLPPTTTLDAAAQQAVDNEAQKVLSGEPSVLGTPTGVDMLTPADPLGEVSKVVQDAEPIAGPAVTADAEALVDDVKTIQTEAAAEAPVVQQHIEQFIADGRARIDLALAPLSVIAAAGNPQFNVIRSALSDAFHEMIRHFATAGDVSKT